MKKMFFTAIALVAFSGISMASEEAKKEEKAKAKNCTSFAYHMTAAYEEIDGCMTSQEYNQMYFYWLTYCNMF